MEKTEQAAAETKRVIEVVGGIIRRGEKYLLGKRPEGKSQGGHWEFIGGKIEPGETPKEALVREIREELKTEIVPGELITTVETDSPSFHLSMQCFFCTIKEGSPVLLEHEAAKWLSYDELESVDWLPADRLVVEEIKRIAAEQSSSQ